jgi:hypothetical protein
VKANDEKAWRPSATTASQRTSNLQLKIGYNRASGELAYMKAFSITALTVTAAFIFCLLGCFPHSRAGDYQYKEEQRIKSPDSKFEAVLVTGDGGATTSTTTFLIIVPTGQKIKTDDSLRSDVVFAADH